MNELDFEFRTRLQITSSRVIDVTVDCRSGNCPKNRTEDVKIFLRDFICSRGFDPDKYKVSSSGGIFKATIPWNAPNRLQEILKSLQATECEIDQQFDWPSVYVVSDPSRAEMYQQNNPNASHFLINGLWIFPQDPEAQKACEVAFKD